MTKSRMTGTDGGDHQGGERIAKAIARAGLASRREAEGWIAAGRVTVNGAVIDSPALNVTAHDRVSVDGEPLPARERTRLFLYHKPRGLLTSRSDPQGRPTIFQRLPVELPRLISVGRLDFNTEGLLLLTNDGALARVLELPATGWLRRYRVRAHGSVAQHQLDELRQGVTVDGVHYGEIDATLERVQGSNLWLSFAIREGKNREVRNVLGHLGLTVTRLIRVSFGPFQLGELAEGKVEEVRTRTLREQLGERVIARSGADFSAPIAPPPRPEKPEAQGENMRPRQSSAPSAARNIAAGDEASRHKRKFRLSTRGDAPSHAWRVPDQEGLGKKLRRKFHGKDRDKGRRERPPGEPRAGLVTDRQGRRVLVERFGRAPQDEQAPAEMRKAGGGRRGRRRPSDRASGPRPRHPRGPRGK